eukprot:jgi/Phyca11/100620/e_gw1.5.1401.1
MECIIHEDPKRVVKYLVEALRPAAFRATIQDSLEPLLKKDVSSFLRWLRPQMEEFMRFETHINHRHGSLANPNCNNSPKENRIAEKRFESSFR